MNHWYVAMCKTGFGEQDRAEDSLLSQMFETFNPKVRIRTMKDGEAIETIEPAFLGYIFVKLNLGRQSASTINNSRGVSKLVSFGDDPTRIRDGVVEELIERFREKSLTISDLPQPGEEIEIKAGPMAGLKAIFKETNGLKRSMIMIDWMGQTRHIDVDNHVLS